MAETGAARSEAAGPITRETLFPEEGQQPEAAELTPEPEAAEGEDLAEAQATDDEQDTGQPEAAETLGRMRLNDFLDAAGVGMEEFYRDVYIDRDGTEVSVSQAWDDYRTLQDANQALLRERNELQKKAEQVATAMPQPGISPEASQMLHQAELYQKALMETDWSQVDPAVAANQRMDLQLQHQHLITQAQQKQSEWQGKQQERINAARAEADRQTRAAIPEWSDPEVYGREWREIKDAMRGYNLSAEEVDAVVDPRVRQLLRDYVKLRQGQERIKAGAKKVRKVGKTLSAGSRVTPAQPSRQQALREARERIKGESTREAKQKARLQIQFPD